MAFDSVGENHGIIRGAPTYMRQNYLCVTTGTTGKRNYYYSHYNQPKLIGTTGVNQLITNDLTMGDYVSPGYSELGSLGVETDYALVVGLGVGALALCVLCAVMLVLLFRRRKKTGDVTPQSIEMKNTSSDASNSFATYSTAPATPQTTSYSSITLSAITASNSATLTTPIVSHKELSKYHIEYDDLIYQRGN